MGYSPIDQGTVRVQSLEYEKKQFANRLTDPFLQHILEHFNSE